MTTNKKSKANPRTNKNIGKTPGKTGGFVALKSNCPRMSTDAGLDSSLVTASGVASAERLAAMKLPELLAPAGSFDALCAAVMAGADAVYFALPDFNARLRADNFTKESFAEGVRLCHSYGVKAYVTLNTQVYDRERSDFLKAAEFAYRAGIDAAIVGDLGCAAMIKKYIPELEIHASTQLSGHNASAGGELSKLGFTRMVLARETSLSDIKKYVKDSPIEAEIFVHGALCVCHSGQCLFSSLVGGRSGNRGLCAQPCRLPYGSGDGGGSGYHLSLKDACLATYIPEIIESGVASLKIEGRMKGAEYVYGVVSIYRRLLDERRRATAEELSELADIFSREGFTDRYFTGNISRSMLGVRSAEDKERSKQAGDVKGAKPSRRIGIKLACSIEADKPMHLTLSLDEKSESRIGRQISVSVEGEIPLVAQSRVADAESVSKNLVKFGSTPFEVTELDIKLGEGLMIPVSSLNALRREGAERILEAIHLPYDERKDFALPSISATKGSMVRSDSMKKEKNLESVAHFMRLSSIPKSAAESFSLVALAAREFTSENADKIRSLGVRGILLPPVIFDSEAEQVEKHLEIAKNIGVEYALVGNLGHVGYAKKFGFKLLGDFRLNVSNSDTARVLVDEFGFEEILLSPELTLPRIRDISEGAPAGAFVYGRIPLMVVEKCVISELHPCAYMQKGRGNPTTACALDKARLTDRTGASFPVLRELDHRNVIFNSLPTYMADRLGEMPDASRLTRHFIFSVESESEVERIITAYKTGARSTGQVRRIGV